MTKEQKQVSEFMTMVGRDVLVNIPTIPDLKTRQLRARLILEECLETIYKGLGICVSSPDEDGEYFYLQDVIETFQFEDSPHVKPNIVELADGLADIHYVAYCGTGQAFGIDMEPIFQEIHRSNMSKLWSHEDWEQLSEQDQARLSKIEVGDRLCVKNSSNKVVKPPSYSPANLQPILDAQHNSL